MTQAPTIFDTAAGIVEKHMPALLKRFQAARLFHFPARAHEVLPKEFSDEERALLHENFFLPFSTIAIEDTTSCTVMWNKEKDQVGLQGERGFVEIQPFTAESILNCADGGDVDPEKIRAQCARYPRGTVAIAEGRFGPVKLVNETKILFEGVLDWVAVATKERGIIAIDTLKKSSKAEYSLVCAPILRNVDTSLQEIFYFNSPRRLILEEMPLRVFRQRAAGRKQPKNRIPRVHERPRYTLLRPTQIRTRLGLKPLGTGGPRRPHQRRRHFRMFPNDKIRWPNAAGKIVIVKACWIGPSEATVDKKHYKVLLDR